MKAGGVEGEREALTDVRGCQISDDASSTDVVAFSDQLNFNFVHFTNIHLTNTEFQEHLWRI